MTLRGLFVTGTDTGIGKTAVSAALMHRYRRESPLRYWKPIETGIEDGDDTTEVARLAGCQAAELFTEGIRLPRPVSPHLAAQWAGRAIDIEHLVSSIGREPQGGRWIIEGAGGVLVPINQTATMIDLMTALRLPLVIVARTALGTINHTLLTLEAVRRRQLSIAGVVMVGDANEDNRAAIEHYGRVAVLGEMPYFMTMTPSDLRAWSLSALDREQRLLKYLR